MKKAEMYFKTCKKCEKDYKTTSQVSKVCKLCDNSLKINKVFKEMVIQ